MEGQKIGKLVNEKSRQIWKRLFPIVIPFALAALAACSTPVQEIHSTPTAIIEPPPIATIAKTATLASSTATATTTPHPSPILTSTSIPTPKVAETQVQKPARNCSIKSGSSTFDRGAKALHNDPTIPYLRFR